MSERAEFALFPRRRVWQISLFEMLLATTAVIAIVICVQAAVPPAFAYTVGFAGGLLGSAAAMCLPKRSAWGLAMAGGLAGVVAALAGMYAFEGFLPTDPRLTKLYGTTRLERIEALLGLAASRGAIGGLVGTVLYSVIAALNEWARRQLLATSPPAEAASP